jgi:uncharacterized cupin superfamily protein
MNDHTAPRPDALTANEVPLRTRPSIYPPVYAARVAGRFKRQLGEPFGLRNFGVNLVELHPGSQSALHHSHSKEDEFIHVLSGEVTLHVGNRQMLLKAGMCAGFPAGGEAHHLENRGSEVATYLEIGDRQQDDAVDYPDDDLRLTKVAGNWVCWHKDGTPW